MTVRTLVKTIQDIMRKDVGVDGDAQRISQLVWMFFLKIYDDREEEIELLEDVTLFGTVANLFDEHWYANSYSQLWVQPGAPRTATIGFRANF